MDCGGVAGEAVVHLEDGPGQSATIHRPEDELVVERAQDEQVFDDVRACPSTPWTPGIARARPSAGRGGRSDCASRSRSPPTLRMPRAVWSAARMSRRSPLDEGVTPSAIRRERRDRAEARGISSPSAGSGLRYARSLPPVGLRSPRRVGIASEHARREATIAPAALAKRDRVGQWPAGEYAVAERAAESVPRAEPVDDLNGKRRHEDPFVVRLGEHAVGAELDDRELETQRRAAGRRPRRGQSLPTAISTSSRLPTAIVARASASAVAARGVLHRRPEVGR